MSTLSYTFSFVLHNDNEPGAFPFMQSFPSHGISERRSFTTATCIISCFSLPVRDTCCRHWFQFTQCFSPNYTQNEQFNDTNKLIFVLNTTWACGILSVNNVNTSINIPRHLCRLRLPTHHLQRPALQIFIKLKRLLRSAKILPLLIHLGILDPLKRAHPICRETDSQPYRGDDETNGKDHQLHTRKHKSHGSVAQRCDLVVHGGLSGRKVGLHDLLRENAVEEGCLVHGDVCCYAAAAGICGGQCQNRHDESL